MLQELTHMDRITQLQDEIQQLLQIMTSSLKYLTSRATFLQVAPHIPVTHRRPEGTFDTPDVMEANRRELINDLLVKTKQVEYLIQSLPVPESDEVQDARLKALDEEMTIANAEYAQALNRAKGLHAQVAETLDALLTEPRMP